MLHLYMRFKFVNNLGVELMLKSNVTPAFRYTLSMHQVSIETRQTLLERDGFVLCQFVGTCNQL